MTDPTERPTLAGLLASDVNMARWLDRMGLQIRYQPDRVGEETVYTRLRVALLARVEAAPSEWEAPLLPDTFIERAIRAACALDRTQTLALSVGMTALEAATTRNWYRQRNGLRPDAALAPTGQPKEET